MGNSTERHAFHFDGTRCTGCKTCALACKDYNGLTSDFAYRQVYEYGGGSWTQDDSGCWTTDSFVYYISISCNHCLDAACMKACPTKAMHLSEAGFVCVDQTRCIGCGYCVLTCPYHAPKLDDNLGHSVKCDGCESRVIDGQVPVCVQACPQRALEFELYEVLFGKLGSGDEVAPLPSVSVTTPSLIVTAPHNGKPVDSDEGTVLNLSEIV